MAELFKMISFPEMDRTLFVGINAGWSNPVMDATMPWISRLADGWVVCLWLVVIGMLLGLRLVRSGGIEINPKERRQRIIKAGLCFCLYLALIYGANSALSHGLKQAIERPRPFAIDPTVILRVSPHAALDLQRNGSFPSGHAANAFMMAALLVEWFRRKRFALYGLAALIALSRIYLGVHYPLDVIAGGCLGLATTRLMLSLRPLRCRMITGEPFLPPT